MIDHCIRNRARRGVVRTDVVACESPGTVGACPQAILTGAVLRRINRLQAGSYSGFVSRGAWVRHCGRRLRLRYTPELVRPLSETSSTLSASAAKSRNIPRKADRAVAPSRRSRELLLIA